MGNELIPFGLEEDAKTFKSDHFGTKIIKFNDIKEDEVYKLD
jgi:nitrous oxide reductase accessory protein NosL